MAEDKPTGFAKKIRIPKFLVPSKVVKQLEDVLAKADIAFSATEWMGIFVTLGIFLFIILAILVSPLVGIVGYIMVIGVMFVLPSSKAGKRKSSIEEALPDVLHHMSVAIRTGLVLESVIKEISEAEYGALSDEFARIVMEMRRGRSLRDALMGFTVRVDSKDVGRAIRLLLEGVEFGGPISEVLDEVSDDMKAVREIQRERKTMTSQQISFLIMASLMAGPFVMGVVASLPTIMKDMAGDIGGGELFPPSLLQDLDGVIVALSFYVIAQAVSSALMMGVVMHGSLKKGFKFTIPMGLAAYAIFTLVKLGMPGAMAMF